MPSISFHYNEDSGEGYMTPKNREKLDGFVFENGGLFAADVLGDFKSDIEFAYIKAHLAMSGEWESHRGGVPTALQIALEISKRGYKPSIELAEAYLLHFDLDYEDEEELVMAVEQLSGTDVLKAAVDRAAHAEADKVIRMLYLGSADTVEDASSYESKVHLAVAHGLFDLMKGDAA